MTAGEGLVTAFTLLGGEEPYRVKARFQNASQLVKGNLIQVSGRPVGKVTSIDLTDSGEAEVSMRIDSDFAPLRQGTQLTVRQRIAILAFDRGTEPLPR